jgi:prolyl-tRNA editing enzyme YbaK/EbsC (Cys-tRNA(Pro) deacylase)
MNLHDRQRMERVASELRQAGVEPQIEQFAASTKTAADAAAALGCEVGAIANSLIFVCAGEPLLVLASGAHRVDTALVAAQLDCDPIERATPSFVRDRTGQVIGGVAPVGHPEHLRTAVDRALQGYDTVWASAGTPNSVFRTSFPQLVALTGGTPVDVA